MHCNSISDAHTHTICMWSDDKCRQAICIILFIYTNASKNIFTNDLLFNIYEQYSNIDVSSYLHPKSSLNIVIVYIFCIW